MGVAAQRPTPPVDAPEMRQQAYQQLLAAAASRRDAGDSSQMMADILNAVDMGRAGRVTDRWATRNAGQAAASTTMLDEYAKALAAARAKAAAAARRASSGGGGGGGALAGAYVPQDDWLTSYLNSLNGGSLPPMPQRPGAGAGRGSGVWGPAMTGSGTTPAAGYAASQHPVAPKPKPKPAYPTVVRY